MYQRCDQTLIQAFTGGVYFFVQQLLFRHESKMDMGYVLASAVNYMICALAEHPAASCGCIILHI